MIPEKQAPAVVGAVVAARRQVPGLQAVLFGDGPQLADVRAAIDRHDAAAFVRAPGFVAAEEVEDGLSRATCLVLPSVREGYGAIVVEAAAHAVPSVLVAAPDNAAVEHVEEGVNGFVAPDASPAALGAAIVAAYERREALRASTGAWFDAHAHELAMRTSLEQVVASYRGGESARR